MALLEVREFPDPVLKKVSRKIKPGDIADIGELVTDMFETMQSAPGVGLAAPQVGRSIRLLVALIGEDVDEFIERSFINPVILDRDGFDISEEGCLSFPELYGMVERATWIKLKYEDTDFNEHIEEFKGFSARVLQHEIDHLDGILINDRADELYVHVAETEEGSEPEDE
ncbi:peptide deformylase [bacterium]|nr:peptide deformylase [bacterium]